MITLECSSGYEFAAYNQLKSDCERFLILSSVTQRLENTPYGAFSSPGLRATLSRRLCQTIRLALPAQDYSEVIIDGKRCFGLIDNQASASVMALDFARKHRYKITPKRVPFELADGTVQYSVGHTFVSCARTRDRQRTRVHEFHIFITCIEPLILGQRLLDDLGILSAAKLGECRSLNNSKEYDPSVSEKFLSKDLLLHPKIRIHIRHSGGIKNVLAIPDKGSGVNAMLLAFAQSMRYNIHHSPTIQYTLRSATGLMIQSVGTVRASFEIDLKSARLNLSQKSFAVIENFPFDIAFGNQFIQGLKIFEANLSCLEWVHAQERLPLLCPISSAPQGKSNLQRFQTNDPQTERYKDSKNCREEATRKSADLQLERERERQQKQQDKEDQIKHEEEVRKKNEEKRKRRIKEEKEKEKQKKKSKRKERLQMIKHRIQSLLRLYKFGRSP